MPARKNRGFKLVGPESLEPASGSTPRGSTEPAAGYLRSVPPVGSPARRREESGGRRASSQAGDQPRAERRLSVRRPVLDVCASSPLIEFVLFDFSAEGIAIETDSALRVGGSYPFEMRQGKNTVCFRGQIRWCRLNKTKKVAPDEVKSVFRAGVLWRQVLEASDDLFQAEPQHDGQAPDDQPPPLGPGSSPTKVEDTVKTEPFLTDDLAGAAAFFNQAHGIGFPAIVNSNQADNGARMFRFESVEEVAELLDRQPELLFPVNRQQLHECLSQNSRRDGLVGLELLGGELLHTIQAVSEGSLSLCPSETCNPLEQQTAGPSFSAYPEVPFEAVELLEAAGLDVGIIEYLKTTQGRRVLREINANSSFRSSLAWQSGIDPFKSLADFLRSFGRTCFVFSD